MIHIYASTVGVIVIAILITFFADWTFVPIVGTGICSSGFNVIDAIRRVAISSVLLLWALRPINIAPFYATILFPISASYYHIIIAATIVVVASSATISLEPSSTSNVCGKVSRVDIDARNVDLVSRHIFIIF